MSTGATDPQDGIRRAVGELERSVNEVLDELSRLRRETVEQQRRLTEARELVRGLEQGDIDALDLTERMGRLEAENADLRRRIQEGREGVERLLARVRFAEEQR